MSRIVILEILFVQMFLMGCIVCPAFADGAPAAAIQLAQVVVQPVAVVVQPAPVVVQPAPVVVQPYAVLEGSESVQVDPEDYYYMDKDIYYHHTYTTDADVVVTAVPKEYHFLHSRIDISKVPQKHFHHPKHEDASPRAVEKTETTTTRVDPGSGTASVEKETTTVRK
jgi:hypothetical protein